MIQNTDNVNAISNTEMIDELTGIYNRHGFYYATRNLLQSHPERQFCIIYWNIRKFKVTNDLFGWATGDKILRHWADRLRDSLHGEDAVYGRLECDNFLCCIDSSFFARDEWKKLGEITYQTDETTYHFFSCCGIYRISPGETSIATMVDKARVAMETIKNNYLCLYAWYNENMWNSLLEEQRMNSDFHNAIADHQFQVYYQPICRAYDGQVSGAEALVRWLHPVKGLIAPDHFIPLFEKNGFISILDRYVWNEVCTALEEQQKSGGTTVPISINVSRVEFYNPNLCTDIYNIVTSHHLEPSLIKIEITESAYSANPLQVAETIEKLHSYGFSVLMDDFGSGYSSLNMLKDLPIDVLKIDMRFLDNFEKSQKAAVVLESVIRLAKWMNLSIVSEGVETQKEWNYLRSMECDMVQGYFFYRPMPKEEFLKLLSNDLFPIDNLYKHDFENMDSSILKIFSQINSAEGELFFSLLGGMGLAEVTVDKLELICVNASFYDTLYGPGAPQMNVLHIAPPEAEQDFLHKQCLSAKLDNTVHQFQLHHKRQDGVYVWLNVKLRYLGGSPQHSLYMFSVVNIDEQKKAERNSYLTTFSLALLNIYSSVYHFNYDAGSIDVVHCNVEDTFTPLCRYSFRDFSEELGKFSSDAELAQLEFLLEREKLDAYLADHSHENRFFIRYHLASGAVLENVPVYVFHLSLPEEDGHYLLCLKIPDSQ